MVKKGDVELTEVSVSNEKTKKSKERRSSEDQTNGQIKPILRLTQSHSSQRRPPSIPTIIETSDEEHRSEGLQTLNVQNLPRKISTASGITDKGNVRESGRSNKSSRSNGGSVNRGFAGSNSDGDALSNQSRYSSSQSLS